MTEDIKPWTAKRKSALVIEIIQGKTTVAAASRTYVLAPSEIEGWAEDARKGMENALKTNPLDCPPAIREAAQGPPGGLRGGHAGAACKREY